MWDCTAYHFSCKNRWLSQFWILKIRTANWTTLNKAAQFVGASSTPILSGSLTELQGLCAGGFSSRFLASGGNRTTEKYSWPKNKNNKRKNKNLGLSNYQLVPTSHGTPGVSLDENIACLLLLVCLLLCFLVVTFMDSYDSWNYFWNLNALLWNCMKKFIKTC